MTYPNDWYDYIKRSFDVSSLKKWEDNNEEFVCFFNRFSNLIKDSSILLIGTGSTEIMFTEWPNILRGRGAKQITYLEIYGGYCNRFANREYEIIQGDVTEIDRYISAGNFDLICWFHGPEHISHEKMPTTFNKIKQMCNKGFVTICPFGSYYDGAPSQDNVYEDHIQSNLSINDFSEVLDASFFSVGTKDAPDAVIFGYYFKEDING